MTSAGENFKTFVRIRPANATESGAAGHSLHGHQSSVEVIAGGKTLRVLNDLKPTYTFDGVFHGHGKEEQMFAETVEPILNKFCRGINSCIMAYGATGSGKTFLMGFDVKALTAGVSAGLCAYSLKYVFKMLEEDEHCRFKTSILMFELYKNEIQDMLMDNTAKKGSQSQPVFDILDDKDGNVKVTGLTEKAVADCEAAINLVRQGSQFRKIRPTASNKNSSRSHLIMALNLECLFDDGRQATRSQLCFVDLAGSEKIHSSTHAVTDTQRQEGIEINKGLLVLGEVIYALTSKPGTYVPYRSHKLTRLLKRSLGGSASTILFGCLSPHITKVQETLNTLLFIDRAKRVKNKPTVNVLDVASLVPAPTKTPPNPNKDMKQLLERVAALEAENKRLKQEAAIKQTRKRKRAPAQQNLNGGDEASTSNQSARSPAGSQEPEDKSEEEDYNLFGARHALHQRRGKENLGLQPAAAEVGKQNKKKNSCSCSKTKCGPGTQCGCAKRGEKCTLNCKCDKLFCQNFQ